MAPARYPALACFEAGASVAARTGADPVLHLLGAVVDGLTDLVGSVIDLFLDAGALAIDLAFTPELLVVSEVASRLLCAALRLIDVLTHVESSPLSLTPRLPGDQCEKQGVTGARADAMISP